MLSLNEIEKVLCSVHLAPPNITFAKPFCSLSPSTFFRFNLQTIRLDFKSSAEIKEFVEDGAVVVRDGKEETIRGFDSIIIAMGARAVDTLSAKIRDKIAEVYVIGYASQARRALEAIAEGAEIGRKI